MAHSFKGVRAVLFDLDGTLADSAPDLAAAVNSMRQSRGLEALPLAMLRPVASHGARGLLGVAFGSRPHHPDYDTLRVEFLNTYERDLCVATRLFDGVLPMIDAIEASGLAWGIVTNKAARFTDPLVELLQLHERAGAIVSGDTTAHAKPHPAPLLHAAEQMGITPEACVYVGDDLRDIQAGQAAAMGTIAAAWGYCADTDPAEWGADVLIREPGELIALVS